MRVVRLGKKHYDLDLVEKLYLEKLHRRVCHFIFSGRFGPGSVANLKSPRHGTDRSRLFHHGKRRVHRQGTGAQGLLNAYIWEFTESPGKIRWK